MTTSQILLVVLLGLTAALGNVLGGFFVVRREWSQLYLRYFVALGAGFMLGIVFLDIIPESLKFLSARCRAAVGAKRLFLSPPLRAHAGPAFPFRRRDPWPRVGASCRLVGLARADDSHVFRRCGDCFRVFGFDVARMGDYAGDFSAQASRGFRGVLADAGYGPQPKDVLVGSRGAWVRRHLRELS